MKRLNKKGFTLVELLAVIVILSVVMLIAVTAVGPLMTKARKGALTSEAASLVSAAKVAYQAEQLNQGGVISMYGWGSGKFVCMDLQWLVKAGYYDKANATDYKGSVKMTKTNESYTYTVYITNKTYKIAGKSVPVSDGDVADGDGDTNYATCGGSQTSGNVYCTGSGCTKKA